MLEGYFFSLYNILSYMVEAKFSWAQNKWEEERKKGEKGRETGGSVQKLPFLYLDLLFPISSTKVVYLFGGEKDTKYTHRGMELSLPDVFGSVTQKRR